MKISKENILEKILAVPFAIVFGILLTITIKDAWKSSQKYVPYDEEKKRQDKLRLKLGKTINKTIKR